jgi:hypothetical protein
MTGATLQSHLLEVAKSHAESARRDRLARSNGERAPAASAAAVAALVPLMLRREALQIED